jgi:hypothetical protein
MRVIRELPLGERKVLVKELTLAELRAWLAELPARAGSDLVDDLFADQDLALADLPVFSDFPAEALGDYAPSDWRRCSRASARSMPIFSRPGAAGWRRRGA